MQSGIILDIDGTLLDSNDAHARAWVKSLAEFDFHIPFERVRPLIGKGGDKVMPELTGLDAESKQAKQIAARRSEIFNAELPSLEPFPETRALLLRMQRAGLELAVGTSAEADLVDKLLERAGVGDLIASRTSSDDAEASKPDPDIVEAAKDDMPAHDHAIIMIGDTPYDIQAARGANVPCIAFRCGGWWKDADFEDALAIYDGPAHLLREFEQSPLGKLLRRGTAPRQSGSRAAKHA